MTAHCFLRVYKVESPIEKLVYSTTYCLNFRELVQILKKRSGPLVEHVPEIWNFPEKCFENLNDHVLHMHCEIDVPTNYFSYEQNQICSRLIESCFKDTEEFFITVLEQFKSIPLFKTECTYYYQDLDSKSILIREFNFHKFLRKLKDEIENLKERRKREDSQEESKQGMEKEKNTEKKQRNKNSRLKLELHNFMLLFNAKNETEELLLRNARFETFVTMARNILDYVLEKIPSSKKKYGNFQKIIHIATIHYKEGRIGATEEDILNDDCLDKNILCKKLNFEDIFDIIKNLCLELQNTDADQETKDIAYNIYEKIFNYLELIEEINKIKKKKLKKNKKIKKKCFVLQ